MDQYKYFEVENFVWDSSFRKWVLNPTEDLDQQWLEWLAANPDSAGKVNEAKQMIQALVVKEEELTDLEIQEAVSQAKVRLQASKPTLRIGWIRRSLLIAASILVVMGLGWSLWKQVQSSDKGQTLASQSMDKGLKSLEGKWEERSNANKVPMEVRLKDGSKVMLAAGSSIRYESTFMGDRRHVILKGEAFFDIAKDPKRPFFVYANGLITKVLGTSFTIRAYDLEKEVTVEVKTGRVSVFAESDPDFKNKLNRSELAGMVLSPNQKVIFERKAVRLIKTLVEHPQMVVPKSRIPQFEFEDTPATVVFDSIAKAYGISILYDKEILSDCPVTAPLDKLSLSEQLSIVCKAVEASYTVVDGQIRIHSTGCKN